MDTDLRLAPHLLQDREATIFNSKLILFFVVIALFLALVYRQSDLSLLSLLILLVMAGSKAWSVLSLGRVSCETKARRERVFAGETIILATTVVNKKFLPVWIRLEWPAHQLAAVLDGKTQAMVQETGILWHQQASFQQHLKAMRRGVYQIGPPVIRTSDFLGFFEKETNTQDVSHVIVYPRLVPLKPIAIRRRDLYGVPGARSPVKDPVYILGTCDYQPSRPSRHIHRSARPSTRPARYRAGRETG